MLTSVTRVEGRTFVSTAGVYRLRLDDPPRYNPKLKCPPAVVPFYVDCNENHGGIRTDMSRYGWLDYIKKLNGDKWEASMDNHLAIFNSQHGETPMMQSLGFECNLFRAINGPRWGWAQILTLNYYDGPPSHMPTWEEDPIAVQKLTAICREGAIIQHANKFCYPVVARAPIFLPWRWLEPFSENMATPAPPK